MTIPYASRMSVVKVQMPYGVNNIYEILLNKIGLLKQLSEIKINLDFIHN